MNRHSPHDPTKSLTDHLEKTAKSIKKVMRPLTDLIESDAKRLREISRPFAEHMESESRKAKELGALLARFLAPANSVTREVSESLQRHLPFGGRVAAGLVALPLESRERAIQAIEEAQAKPKEKISKSGSRPNPKEIDRYISDLAKSMGKRMEGLSSTVVARLLNGWPNLQGPVTRNMVDQSERYWALCRYTLERKPNNPGGRRINQDMVEKALVNLAEKDQTFVLNATMELLRNHLGELMGTSPPSAPIVRKCPTYEKIKGIREGGRKAKRK
jgi:hypothetical protein